jgi:prepilin-type processing-associated H-X9-DG protein
MTHIVNIPSFSSYTWANVVANGWQPGPNGTDTSVYTNGGVAFYVDGNRHAKRGAPKSADNKTMNMLFLDGHAGPVSVKDAWEAFTGKKVAGG